MSDPPELTGVAAWAVSVMETLGGPGASLIIALENVFPPIPSELILPLAGFTASQGTFTLTGAIFWTTLGSVTGALIIYSLGAALGRSRFRAIWARLPLVDLADLDRTEAWFERHGHKAVFLGRMIPLIRSLISIPAGIEGMPLRWFVPLTVAGSAVWNSLFIFAGYQLGQNWHRVDPYADTFQAVVAVVLTVMAGWFVFRRLQRRRQQHDVTGSRR